MFRNNIRCVRLFQAVLIVFTGLLSSTLLMGKNSDFQSWNTFITTKELGSSYLMTNELHLRLSHDASKFSQFLIRPSIQYNINSLSSVALGYTWVYSSTPLAVKNTHEHNIWQQYQVKAHYYDLTLLSRSRLEEQFIQRVPKTAWRLRQFFNLIKPIDNTVIDFFSVSNEIFILFNDTSKVSDNRGFNENRFYLGLGKNLNNHNILQLGYQYQHIRRFKQNNLNANMVVVMVNTSFI